MQITIQNFRGVKHAALNISGIALIAGLNGSGKSSIALATAACLTGETMPLAGYKKPDAGLVVRTGEAGATATVSDAGGAATVTWPQAKLKTDGAAPQSSIVGAGLQSVVDMKEADAVALMGPYLGAVPTKEDLATALPDLTPELITKLWEKIEINGWDVAHGEAKDKGIRLKGQWQQATGEAYGDKKAAAWVPALWEESLATASEDSLDALLVQEKDFHEGVVATNALSANEQHELKLRAEALPALEDQLTRCQADRAELERQRDELDLKIKNAAPPKDDAPQACPHCSQPVQVTFTSGGNQFMLAKAEPVDKDKLREARKAHAQACGQLTNLQGSIAGCVRSENDLQRRIGEAKQAVSTLASTPASTEEDIRQLEDARERIKRAESRLKAFRDKREADRLHANVGQNQRVIDALAITGVRARKLANAIEAFNIHNLAPVCHAAEWADVALDEHLRASFGGRPYGLLAESEKFRVRVTLQLAMARADRSHLVVIDEADILDASGRKGLLGALHELQLPALVCMTITNPVKQPAPDLKAAGLGVTYWINQGTAEELCTGS